MDTGVVSLLEGTHGSLQQIEINELTVTILCPSQWVVVTGQAAMDETTTWNKIKRTL